MLKINVLQMFFNMIASQMLILQFFSPDTGFWSIRFLSVKNGFRNTQSISFFEMNVVQTLVDIQVVLAL